MNQRQVEEVRKEWEKGGAKRKHKRKTKNGKWRYEINASKENSDSEITNFITEMNDLDEEIIDQYIESEIDSMSIGDDQRRDSVTSSRRGSILKFKNKRTRAFTISKEST